MKKHLTLLLLLTLAKIVPLYADTTIPATGEVAAFLSSGYDSKNQIRTGKCIDGDVQYVGKNISNESFVHNASYKQIIESLSGGVSGHVQFAYFNVNGQFDYASKNAATDLDITYTDNISITPKKITLTNYRIAKGMQNMITNPDGTVKDTVEQFCGDQFVTQGEVGARLFINIKFTFRNSSEKKNFYGKLGVNIFSIANIIGELSAADKRILSTAVISITTKQIGGDVTALAKALPPDSVYCGLTDEPYAVNGKTISPIKVCLEILNSFSNYKKDFALQLKDKKYDPKDPKGWAYFNWIATSYKNALVENAFHKPIQIIPSKPSPPLLEAIQHNRERLKAAYDKNLEDQRKASELMLFNLSFSDKKKMMDVSTIIGNNLDLITEAVKKCFGDDISYCETAATDALSHLASYDPSVFLIYGTPNSDFVPTGLWRHVDAQNSARRSFLSFAQKGAQVSLVFNDPTAKHLTLFGRGGYASYKSIFMAADGTEDRFRDTKKVKCLLKKSLLISFVSPNQINLQWKPEKNRYEDDTYCSLPMSEVCIFNQDDTPPILDPPVQNPPICPTVAFDRISK
jgi:hypothetical protein